MTYFFNSYKYQGEKKKASEPTWDQQTTIKLTYKKNNTADDVLSTYPTSIIFCTRVAWDSRHLHNASQ